MLGTVVAIAVGVVFGVVLALLVVCLLVLWAMKDLDDWKW